MLIIDQNRLLGGGSMSQSKSPRAKRRVFAAVSATGLAFACVAALSSPSSGSTTSGSGAVRSAAASVPFSSFEQSVAASYPKPKHGKFRLAYLDPAAGNEFLNILGRAMGLETKRLGGTFTQLSDVGGSVNTQVTEFNQLIAQKVNGIAVFALDPKSLAPDVARARKAGIHLVTIDLSFANAPASALGGYESQVLQRRDQAAYSTATYMAKHLAAGSSLGTIDFVVKVPSIVFSIQRDVFWAKKYGLKIAGSASNPSDDIAGGEKAGTTLINHSAGIKGVMAYNDPSAIGAYTAARSAGVSGLIFGGENGGSDALAAVKAGTETFSLKLDAPGMGKAWAWGLYDLIQGVKVPGSVKAGAPVLVTKSNVNSVVSWEQQLKNQYPGS
jgi:ribose transport system substrate-binding protein